MGDLKSVLGKSVSMSNDGTRIAISSVHNNDNPGSNMLYSYKVMIYEEDPSAEGGWIEFGSILGTNSSTFIEDARADLSFSGNGNRLAISTVYGSYRENFPDNSQAVGGTVEVYEVEVSSSSTSWNLLKEIYGGDAGQGGFFLGLRASLDSNGYKIVMGERYFDDGGFIDRGRVSVCDVASGACEVVATGDQGDEVGSSVMISDNGECVIFGATGTDSSTTGQDSGSASVYCQEGGDWTLRGMQLNGEAAFDEFGISVAISSNGDYIAVGSWKNDAENQIDAGHVRVFKYDAAPGTEKYIQIGGEFVSIASTGYYSTKSYSLNLLADIFVSMCTDLITIKKMISMVKEVWSVWEIIMMVICQDIVLL